MVSVDPKAIRFLRPLPVATEAKAAEDASKPEGEDGLEEPKAEAKPVKKVSEINPDTMLTHFNLPPYATPFIFIPAYIEVCFKTCSAIFVRRPTARYNYSEIPSPYEADGEIMRLSWEWYNKVRPRLRSKSQLARMPENRKETRRILGVDDVKPSSSKPELPTGTTLNAQIARNSAY